LKLSNGRQSALRALYSICLGCQSAEFGSNKIFDDSRSVSQIQATAHKKLKPVGLSASSVYNNAEFNGPVTIGPFTHILSASWPIVKLLYARGRSKP